MDEPKDYRGPLDRKLPEYYVDVTSLTDTERLGIPGMDHPYYVMLRNITRVIRDTRSALPEQLAMAIMKVL